MKLLYLAISHQDCTISVTLDRGFNQSSLRVFFSMHDVGEVSIDLVIGIEKI